MNISQSDLNLSKVILEPNTNYFIEDVCKPYVSSLATAYITIAIFNIAYSFVYPILKKREDKILFKFEMENIDHIIRIRIKDICNLLEVIWFMLNFFVFGYWLVYKYTDWFVNMPFARWFS